MMERTRSSRPVKEKEDEEEEEEEEGEDEEELPLGVYLNWVKTELDNESACLELPFTIILLLSFSCLAYLHLKQADVFTVEGSTHFDIEQNANFAWSRNFGHKTIYDVNSIADFYSWLRIGLLPLVVQHSWGYSESLQDGYEMVRPANATSGYNSGNLPGSWKMQDFGPRSLPIRDDYLHYNRLVGGIRLRQERSTASWEACRMPDGLPEKTWRDWLGKPCSPADPPYELSPEVGDAEVFGVPAREEWLLTIMVPVKELQMKTIDMEDGCSFPELKIATTSPAPAGTSSAGEAAGGSVAGNHTCLCRTCSDGGDGPRPWLDEQTQRVQIGFVLFNWEYGLYTWVTLDFFFNRGGRIYKLINTRSCWADPFAGTVAEVTLMVSCDLVWLISLTYILVCEVKEVIHVILTSKEKWYVSLWRDYIEFWNTVDWISICVAYFVVACWLRLYLSTLTVNGEFQDIAGIDVATTSPEEYTAAIAAFFDVIQEMCLGERLYRISFMFYPMVVMLRLFKSFDAQPRLAVVTQTLVVATKDMVHFFIVFFSCYVCFAVNAVLLFGQDMEDFSTLPRAVITCFRGLFGDSDYARMREVGLLPVAIWSWAFQLLLFLILLNILLAILREAYGEVKSRASNQLTLPKQISEMVRRYRQTQRKERVRHNEIWQAFFRAIGDERDMVVSEAGPGFEEGTGGRELVTARVVRERIRIYTQLDMPMLQVKRQLRTARQEKENKEFRTYEMEDVHKEMERLNTLTRDVRDQTHTFGTVMRHYDFDVNDEQLQYQVPEAPEQECTEHRELVADAVRSAVGRLSGEIAGSLGKEAALFETRQKELEMAQADMTACAKDVCLTLGRLRARTDDIAQALQQQVAAGQRQRFTARGSASAGGSGGSLASCRAPMTAAPDAN